MEKKKDNRGGARVGAGRKSRSEEFKLIEKLDSLIDPMKAIEVLHKKAIKNEDFKALEMYYKYRFGLPKQVTDITTNGESLNTSEGIDISKLSGKELKSLMDLIKKTEG
jgi:hypothetical protein